MNPGQAMKAFLTILASGPKGKGKLLSITPTIQHLLGYKFFTLSLLVRPQFWMTLFETAKFRNQLYFINPW